MVEKDRFQKGEREGEREGGIREGGREGGSERRGGRRRKGKVGGWGWGGLYRRSVKTVAVLSDDIFRVRCMIFGHHHNV